MTFLRYKRTDFDPDITWGIEIGIIGLFLMGIVFSKAAVEAFGDIWGKGCGRGTKGTTLDIVTSG